MAPDFKDHQFLENLYFNRNNRSIMKERTLEDAKQTLIKLDKRTFDERVMRLKELGIMWLSAVERPSSQRMDDYTQEATKSFIEGCFRSCIFCCAAAVAQTFRHEIIFESKNPKEEFKRIERKTFGPIIDEAKKYERLRPFLEDAKWLNKLRNTIAAHPICFWPFPEDEMMENEIIVKGLKNIIAIADAEDREMIEQLFIIREDRSKVVLIDVLRDLNTPGASELLMWRLDNDILKPLALKAHQRMVKILEGLYQM